MTTQNLNLTAELNSLLGFFTCLSYLIQTPDSKAGYAHLAVVAQCQLLFIQIQSPLVSASIGA